MLLPTEHCELYIEPQLDGYPAGSVAPSYYDHSGNDRTISAASNYPLNSTPAINGKAAIYWDGTMNSLANAESFPVQCGWIVAKYNDAAFPSGANGYKGLLTDLDSLPVLVGSQESANFFDFGYEFFEFRTSDRIRPVNNAPAPMTAYKVIFFRFWQPRVFNGVQLGQDRNLTGRKWKGFVGLLALYSRNFCESDIRKYSKIIADNFALSLADVYPYQSDKNAPRNSVQGVNFYDPPEGARISEVLSDAKISFDLQFTSRRQAEVNEFLDYHESHYAPALPCIYRDYKFIPPRDYEGYIDSPYDLDGAVNNFSYSFRFKGKLVK